jgi:hypothetical protein
MPAVGSGVKVRRHSLHRRRVFAMPERRDDPASRVPSWISCLDHDAAARPGPVAALLDQ